MTGDELFDKWNALTEELEANFLPLKLAVESVLRKTEQRIFDDGVNVKGEVMLDKKPYSTKPTYISRIESPRQVPFDTGKRGTKIKSYYFPNGYSQFKQAIGRSILELSLDLRNDWVNADVVLDKTVLTVALKQDYNAQKAEGLQKESQYGRFFGFTEKEQQQVAEIIEIELANLYNR